MGPNKTKLTGPPPSTLAKWKAARRLRLNALNLTSHLSVHPLLPLLPESIETSFRQVLRDHGDSEATVGVEFQEERLRKKWNPRLIGDIDNENRTACAMLLHEIRCFRLKLGENLLDDCADCSSANKAVEWFVG